MAEVHRDVCQVEWLQPGVRAMDEEDLRRINDLYRQFVLDGQPPAITMKQLMRTTAFEHIAVAQMTRYSRSSNMSPESAGMPLIMGMGTLYVCHSLVGDVGRIGQFVVDKEVRGRGVGASLVMFMVHEAKKLGLEQLGLTSDIRRVEAHRFYQRLGFNFKDSKVMRRQL